MLSTKEFILSWLMVYVAGGIALYLIIGLKHC